MQGIWIRNDDIPVTRPRSKKQIRELMGSEAGRMHVIVEATSVFGNEYDGPAIGMPIGAPVYFVGPDPYVKRNFYGTITRTAADKWSVK